MFGCGLLARVQVSSVGGARSVGGRPASVYRVPILLLLVKKSMKSLTERLVTKYLLKALELQQNAKIDPLQKLPSIRYQYGKISPVLTISHKPTLLAMLREIFHGCPRPQKYF